MTDKTKNIVLVIGFVLTLFISFKLAISETFKLRKQAKELIGQESLYEDSPKILYTLQEKRKHYDSILLANRLDGTSLQNNLLRTINSFADKNELKVISFLEPHVINKNGVLIKTYDFTLEGGYNDILKLVYQLEQQTKFGEVINLHFEKKKNYRTGRNYLQVRVLLKSFG